MSEKLVSENNLKDYDKKIKKYVEDNANAPIKSISTVTQALTPDANGKVTIPTTQEGGWSGQIAGVTSVCLYSGLSTSGLNQGYGVIWCKPTDDSYISNRTKAAGIVPAILTSDKINNIVIAALSDSNKIQMTDAERLSALQALGCTVDANGFVKWTAQQQGE